MVTKVTEDDVEVSVDHEDKTVPAIIPINHLTDNVSMAPILASNLVPGQKLRCLAWHKDVVTVMTKKQVNNVTNIN